MAWIPQGLAVTVTMLLTISGRRMAERSVLVKDLHGVETLGAMYVDAPGHSHIG